MGKSLKGKELGTGITQRKDGRYSAKFKSESGKRIEKYFDKLAEARKWLSEAKYEDSHGDISSSTDMTVDAWFNYWISEIKAKTVRWSTLGSYKDRYNINVKELIGNMIVSDVKPMHCQNVLNVMDNNGYVGSSMARTKATLSAMFSDACAFVALGARIRSGASAAHARNGAASGQCRERQGQCYGDCKDTVFCHGNCTSFLISTKAYYSRIFSP